MARRIEDIDVLIYAARDPDNVLFDLGGREPVGVLYVEGRRVCVESRNYRRVIYLPVFNGKRNSQLLIGVVGYCGFVRDEKFVLEGRYGRGSVVDVTNDEKLGKLKGLFILLNRAAREQRM